MTDFRQILLNAVEQADLTEAIRIGQRHDYRSYQVTLIDDAPPLDPVVKARLEKAWDQWTSTCTTEEDENDTLDDINQVIETVRAEKLNRTERGRETFLWHQTMLQTEFDAVIEDIVNKGAQPWRELEPTEDDYGMIVVDRGTQVVV
ncbi:hypothetical protein [Allorhizobium undicola]|uniref:hypothetical protein n=1 Tax=Allorhizobium undicola TaxID=78527 RepID=UPI0004817EA0|nr:hypothetical protein [Allorhizobium undicola]